MTNFLTLKTTGYQYYKTNSMATPAAGYARLWVNEGPIVNLTDSTAGTVQVYPANASSLTGTLAAARLPAIALSSYLPGGRLTLMTGTPVTSSDITAAGTLYYTPYLGNTVATYNGSTWTLNTFTEKSLALTLASGKNYDVFLVDTTLVLELSAAWTTDTIRSEALTTQDGVVVKSGATTRRWLGTIGASGSNIIEDSKAKRLVWNAYNRVTRKLEKLETTSSWTYNSATWRSVNAADTNRVEVVTGALADETSVAADASTSGGTGTAIAIGLDSTTAPSSGIVGYRGGGAHALSQGFYADTVFGRHYFQALERCQDGSTYTSYGQFTATTILIQTGLRGSTWA